MLDNKQIEKISNLKVEAISLAVVQNQDLGSLIGLKVNRKAHPITQEDIDVVTDYMDETAVRAIRPMR